MILVDTSVWIDHLRTGVPALAMALEDEQVLMHPFVLGELACRNLRDRNEVLRLLAKLPRVTSASDAEVLQMIEHRSLMGKGLGYIDVHLLASVALEGTARLWTHDRRLAAVAAELGLAREGGS